MLRASKRNESITQNSKGSGVRKPSCQYYNKRFFLRSKKRQRTFRTTFRITGLLYPYLFDLKTKKSLRHTLGVNLS